MSLKIGIAMACLIGAFGWLMSGAVQAAAVNGFYDSADHRLSVEQAALGFEDYDVVIFGEYHDNREIHEQEFALFQALSKKNPQMVLSLEMFERDTQLRMNGFLAGTIGEAEFLAQSRPWDNYAEDYRPNILFAKEHKLPVLAANLPRYLAAQYAREGGLDKIAPDQAVYLPRRHNTAKGAYYEAFSVYMMSGQTGMQMNEAKMEAFYKAQCLKDDTMAESILLCSLLRTGEQIYHLQGEFHSRDRLGVVEKLAAIAPQLRIGVIHSVYVKSDSERKEAVAKLKQGDLLYVVYKSEP